MKKIFASLLILLTVLSVSGQNFEGIITYKNTYKSKLPNLDDKQFTAMMGTNQKFYIKGGNYKSVVNGTFSQWQLYTSKSNKLYSKLAVSDTIYWNDGSENDDSIINFQLTKNVIEILGYQCDELILTCKSGIQKYYFNAKIGVNSELYRNMNYGNWHDYLKISHALPMKLILDSSQFTIESVATEVKPVKIEDKEFLLPANSKTAKSTF